MSKWIRTLTLAGVFAAGAGGVISLSSPTALAQAQGKAKAAEQKAVEPKKPAAATGTIVIKPDAKGKFRIYVKEGTKTLFMSTTGEDSEKEARAVLEEIKAIMTTAKVTVEKADEKDK